MKAAASIALAHALILASFLWLRPVIASLGLPERPDAGPVTPASAPPLPPATPTAPAPAETAADYARAAQEMVRTPPAGARFLAQVEQRIVALTNEARRKQGKTVMADDEGLRLAARVHSMDMVLRVYMEHVSLEGRTPGDRVAILHRRLVGVVRENIAMNDGADPAQVEDVAQFLVKMWMDSPGHKANILHDTNTHIGVGVAVQGNTLRATQVLAEVRAFLQEDVRLALKRDDTLTLLTAPRAGQSEAERYDFWLPEKGMSAIAARSIRETQVNMEPGTYRMRLYFPNPKASGHIIYNAPDVMVVK